MPHAEKAVSWSWRQGVRFSCAAALLRLHARKHEQGDAVRHSTHAGPPARHYHGHLLAQLVPPGRSLGGGD